MFVARPSSPPTAAISRLSLVHKALSLELFTVGWMVIEASVGIFSGIAAHSVSLTAFGFDSIIEVSSAAVLIWRLKAEVQHICDDPNNCGFQDSIEHRAAKTTALLLFILSAYIVIEASAKLWHHQGEDFSVPGLIVTLLAIPIMISLSNAKSRLAAAINSAALRADSAQATACWYLSVVVVSGLLIQLAFQAWWVDGVASLAILYFVLREGREAWRGNPCC